MSSLRLLVVQPDSTDPPGRLGHWLEQAGAELDVHDPASGPLRELGDEYHGLVCLGGQMGVHDVADYPWLTGLQRMLAQATSRRIPTLGICLGAQLLATANGGEVGKGETPEVGPGLVSKRDAAWQDPLLSDLPLLQDVLQYHEDFIRELPLGAELLASAAGSANQAFRINPCAYGFQFHIETTPETVAGWARQSPEMAAWAREGAFDEGTVATLHDDIEEIWQPVVANFAMLASGALEPAQGRGLPLR